MPHERADLHIAFDPDDEQIRGRVIRAGRPDRPFAGWLALIAAIDGLLGETSGLPPGVAAGRLDPATEGGGSDGADAAL